MQLIYVHSFQSPIGKITLASSDAGLAIIKLAGERSADFQKMLAKRFGKFEKASGGTTNKKAQKQILAYLSGKRRTFEIELDIEGTPFQKKVWQCVRKIPYGATTTYGQIARSIRNDGASRAVGSANGRNSLPLIIPCHRVVALSGLGGYAGGLATKKKLLKIEGSL